jgi:phosphopantothenoylcysteine decarboxylase/phosphopantothenate--cysteine ligase
MIGVRSTQQMLEAVMENWSNADVLIAAAAPADFRPVQPLTHKWKKSAGIPTLELESTPDILATAAANKQATQFVVGFAAETRDAVQYGMNKLIKKGLDMIVVNDVTEPGAGFAGDTNHVLLLRRDGTQQDIPLASKRVVADSLLDEVMRMRTAGNFVTGA